MNEEEKTVLQNHTLEILEGVYMEERLLGAFLQSGVFTSTMIEAIRAKLTPSEKLFEILLLLPTRGPTAFNRFIEIIQEDYEWLANKLLKARCEELERSEARQREYDMTEAELRHQVNDLHIPQPPVSDPRPATRDGSQDSRMSYSPNLDQLGNILSSHTEPKSQCEEIYMKIKMKNSLSFFHRGNTEISMGTPQPVTVAMVDRELDHLLHRFEDMEHILKHVNTALGIENMILDPVSYIINLQLCKRDLTKQAKESAAQKNKYCDRINKLESRCRDQSSKIDQLETELKKRETLILKSYKESKEAKDSVTEKEQEIAELKRLNEELEAKIETCMSDLCTCQADLKKLKDENEVLKTAAPGPKSPKPQPADTNHRNRNRESQRTYRHPQGDERERVVSISRNQTGFRLAVGNSLDIRNNNTSIGNSTQSSEGQQTVQNQSQVRRRADSRRQTVNQPRTRPRGPSLQQLRDESRRFYVPNARI